MTNSIVPTPLALDDTTGDAERTTWKVRDRGLVRAELTKFFSVRSNVVTLVAAAIVTIAFGVLFSAIAGIQSDGSAAPPPPGPGQGATDSVAVAFAGVSLAQLILGVLGALLVTSEYSSGLIRTVFAAVPKRSPVLRAKAVVVGVITLLLMTVTSFVTFLAAQAVYAGDEVTYTLADTGIVRVIIGNGVYLTGVALMGLALGFLLRSTAAAVATLIGLLMIAPGLSGLLPDSIGDAITKLLPSNAGSAFTQLHESADLLSPASGFAVFAVWVIGLLAAAAVLLRRRDA